MEIIQIGVGESWVCMLYGSTGVHVSCGPVLVDDTTPVPSSTENDSDWLAVGAQHCHMHCHISSSHKAEFSCLTEYIAYIFQIILLSFLVEGEH